MAIHDVMHGRGDACRVEMGCVRSQASDNIVRYYYDGMALVRFVLFIAK
jgi:hypothetical protein